ncbi:cupin domain-containing protein [Aquabacterium sp.]|uniref:cupin domain-containing protein n=1 Tax=Aquabacterium sp. TaxID=1872578 RepID=UPI0025B974FA|nr:cupin domain-containing protein [Aquabacterium sp.]
MNNANDKTPTHQVTAADAMRNLGEWPVQKFHVTHLADSKFEGNGLRPYVVYRDLGTKDATGGLVDAHVNARGRPFEPEAVSKRHIHDVKFQMVYVLKGWMRAEFDGHGEHRMVVGSSWVQPAGIKHTVLEYSDDLEVLEIIVPAKYDTINVDELPGGKAAA